MAKRYINKKTGQITQEKGKLGATDEYNPQPQKRFLGSQEVSKEEFTTATRGGGESTPNIEAFKEKVAKLGEIKKQLGTDFLTPEMVQNTLTQEQQMQQQKEQQAQATAEAGTLPTQEKTIIEPFFSKEGQQQFYEGLQNKAGTQNNPTIAEALQSKDKGDVLKAAYGLNKELFYGVITGLEMGVEYVGGNLPFGIGQMVDSALGDNKKIVGNIKSSISQMSPQINNVITAVKAGYPAELAKEDLKAIEQNINQAERNIQQEAITSIAIRSSGDIIDIQAQLLKVRQDIFLAKAELRRLGV